MMSEPALTRRVWATIDLDALRHNTRLLCARAAPARVMAVIKANGYGHGALPVAEAAIAGGATWLGVATAWEAVDLLQRRTTGKRASAGAPILVLSEPQSEAAAEAIVQRWLTPVVYTEAGIEMLAKTVVSRASGSPLPVHLKVDTGMHRVGCTPEQAVALAEGIADRDELTLEGVCTHFAVADELHNPYTLEQIARFEDVLAALDARGLRPPIVHAANSAALLAFPDARYDLVRVGIALYGVPPAERLAGALPLRPAMTVTAHVSHLQRLDAGEGVSYGLHYRLTRPGTIATVPVGYADGVHRSLGLRGGQVLVRGRRYPIVGAVTMDQLMVDIGDDPVEVGDEVVLLGRQGGEEITAVEWAGRMETIAYEIVCGIGSRVPRRYA
jgi:alanine racemase